MEGMNTAELLQLVAEENQTRKILILLNESKDLEEAKEKVKALLTKEHGNENQKKGCLSTLSYD